MNLHKTRPPLFTCDLCRKPAAPYPDGFMECRTYNIITRRELPSKRTYVFLCTRCSRKHATPDQH